MILFGEIIKEKYKIIQNISEGEISSVWSAVEQKYNKKVILKILNKSYMSNDIEDIIRFKHEVKILSTLDIEETAKIIEVGEFENKFFIAMEYIEGDTLDKYVSENTLSIDDIVKIFLKISNVLQKIHNANILHKDLKPQNIMICKKKNQDNEVDIKIIDFGFSQLINFDITNKDVFSGTLKYASPEQIGLIKRNIDEKSDLYSVGVIFYEMLTKNFPFEGKNINELIYNQMSKKPKMLGEYNLEIQDILSKIVLKLLEKEPEKRYFSADGFGSDLKKYLMGKNDFILGLNDKKLKIKYETVFSGREEEVNTLIHAFENIDKNNGKMILISGSTGMGKSRIVEEYTKFLKCHETLIINTEDMLGQEQTEYRVLKDIIILFLRQFENFSQDEKNLLKVKLKSEMGEFAGLLIQMFPITEQILGKCAPVENLEEDEKNIKNHEILECFFKHISSIKNSLVIIINEIETMDNSSMIFFLGMLKNIAKYKIIIVATSKKKNIFIEQQDILPIEVIKLKPLEKNKLNEFLSQILISDEKEIMPLTECIYQKSRGNPKFTVQILKKIINENILRRENEKWVYDQEKIKNISISQEFLNFLMEQIINLSNEELYILTIAACIGKDFDVNVLKEVCKENIEVLNSNLDKFYKLQIIDKEQNKNDIFFFSDNDIRTVLLERVDEKNGKILHNVIGKYLEEKYKDTTKEHMLEICEHFIKSGNEEKIEKYALEAGMDAFKKLDTKSALEYFNKGLELLIKKDDKDKIIEYKIIIGEINQLIGNVEQAEKIFNELYNNIGLKNRRIKLLINLAILGYKKHNKNLSKKYSEELLLILEEKIPVKNISFLLLFCFEQIKKALLHVKPEFIKFKKYKKGEERYKNIIGVYALLAAIYSKENIQKSKYFALKQFNIMKCIDSNTEDVIKSLNVLCEYYYYNTPVKGIKMCKTTLNLGDDCGLKYQKAKTLKILSMCYKKMEMYSESIDNFKQASEFYKLIGNYQEYYDIENKIFDIKCRMGLYGDALRINKEYFDFVIKSKDKNELLKVYCNFLMVYIVLGEEVQIKKYQNEVNNLLKNEQYLESDNIQVIRLLGLSEFEIGGYQNAIKYLKDAIKLNNENESNIDIYLDMADILLEYFKINKNDMILSEKNRIIKNIKKCIYKVKNNEYLSKQVKMCRILAKYYFVMNIDEKANKYYKKGIKKSFDSNDEFQKGKLYLEYSEFLLKDNQKEKFMENIELAYISFRKINSKKYIGLINQKLGIESTENKKIQSFTEKIKNETQLKYILKLSQYISSILDIDTILERVLDISIRCTGAESGYIFIKNKESNCMEQKVSKFEDEVQSNTFYSKNIINMIEKTGQSVLTIDAGEDKRFLDNRSVIVNEFKSVIAIPIRYGEQIKGICYLNNTLSSGIFNENDVEILECLMNQTAISLENAELYKMAVTDGLTNLLTHKHFKYILNNEIERSNRHNRKLSVVMLDIDFFKKFNDKYGHQAGDYVLSEVANLTKKTFRLIDYVARYGGEEFTVLLPETDIEGAYIVSERLRSIIENTEFIFGKDKFKVTISMGISEFKKNGASSEEIIKAADRALYKSKENGRNLVSKAE